MGARGLSVDKVRSNREWRELAEAANFAAFAAVEQKRHAMEQRDNALRDLGNANAKAAELARDLQATRADMGAMRDALGSADAVIESGRGMVAWARDHGGDSAACSAWITLAHRTATAIRKALAL